MEKYQSSDQYSYTLGMSISIELITNHPDLVEKVYYSSKMLKNDNYDKLLDLCYKHHIPLYEDDKVIRTLSVKENCYVIAVFRKFELELESDKHLVLMNFDDDGTLGTVFRTAISFNHRDIILINSKVDYFDPKVIRPSMGAVFYTHIKQYPSIEAYLDDYPLQNLYLISDEGGEELTSVDYKEPYSLIYDANNTYRNELMKEVYIAHRNYKNIPIPMVFGISLHHLYALSKRKR